MAIQHIIGSTDAVVTGGTQVESDSNSHVVTVEGPWDVIDTITDYSDYVPSGFTFVEAQKRNNQGFGTIEIRCQKFGSSDASTTPTRTTWRIEMAAVDTPLYCHPDITSVENARKEIDCWLNTESGKRFDSSGNPQWVDEFGTPQPVNNQGALKYINAWKKGVETYLRYFPIVEKISTYSRLPGCSMSDSSTTSGTADFRMRFFNPDGSEAEMCGNGARCVAAFAREIGAAPSDTMRFETIAGLVEAEIIRSPSTRNPQPSTSQLLNSSTSQLVKIALPDPKDLREGFVNSGVPHKIVPVEDIEGTDVAGEGRRIRYSAEFAPAGTNVDFVRYRPPHDADIRTYERGVEAESGACGTGSVAAAVVGVAQYGLSFPVAVHTVKGFELTIGGNADGSAFSDIALTGPVARVFDGEIELATCHGVD